MGPKIQSALDDLKKKFCGQPESDDPEAALRRLVERASLPSAQGAPWDGMATEGPSLAKLDRVPESQASADEVALGLERNSKLNIRGLIDRAGVGEPCPEAIPSDEALKKLAAAARLGLNSPPDAFPGLRSPGSGTNDFSKWLVAFVHRAVGELLLWRATPLGILSELHQVASLGCDGAFVGDEGFRTGVLYSALMREKAFKKTRAAPMSKCPSAFPSDLAEMESMWHSRNEGVVIAARRALIGKAPVNLDDFATGQKAPDPEAKCCLWHGIRKCSQKSCKRFHDCPFCGGTECGSKEGYLDFHLGKLKTPRAICQVDGGQPSRPGKPWGRSRSPRKRARSRSARASNPVRKQRF